MHFGWSFQTANIRRASDRRLIWQSPHEGFTRVTVNLLCNRIALNGITRKLNAMRQWCARISIPLHWIWKFINIKCESISMWKFYVLVCIFFLWSSIYLFYEHICWFILPTHERVTLRVEQRHREQENKWASH